MSEIHIHDRCMAGMAMNYIRQVLMQLRPVVALVALVALGCSDDVKPPILARSDPYIPAQVHVASHDLRRHIAVGQPQVSRDDAGLLFVTLPIRAATDQKLYVDYPVSFFDRNGAPLSQTEWLHKTLTANVPDQITVNSSSSRAADFQMDLRYSQ